jgi:Lon protease-like protein
MFPLSTVLFPRATMPLHVFEPRYRSLMRDCLSSDQRFGVILIERGSEVGGGDVRAALGTKGLITKAIELPDGRWLLQVVGESVVEVDEWLPEDPYPVALVRERGSESAPASAPRAQASDGEASALLARATQRVRRARAVLAEHGGGAPLSPDIELDGGGDLAAASWELCAAAPLSAYDAQRLLAVDGTAARARLLLELMEELELDLHRMLSSE